MNPKKINMINRFVATLFVRIIISWQESTFQLAAFKTDIPRFHSGKQSDSQSSLRKDHITVHFATLNKR